MPLLALEPFLHPADLLDQPPADDLGRWWVLHTRPRAEKTLARRLHGREVRHFLPLYERHWKNNGRAYRSYLPLFPGYVFLHGDQATRVQALETNLVAQVLPVDDQQRLFGDLQRVHRLLTTGA